MGASSLERPFRDVSSIMTTHSTTVTPAVVNSFSAADMEPRNTYFRLNFDILFFV